MILMISLTNSCGFDGTAASFANLSQQTGDYGIAYVANNGQQELNVRCWP